MATIVEMINPLTGLPEQVDKLDHTAQEIDDAVDLAPQLSNPNLLDNWYFGNPVDQRQGRVVVPNTTYYSDNTLTTSAGTTSAYVTAYRYVTGTASGVSYASFKLEDTDTAPTYYAAPENVVRGYTGAGYGIDRLEANELVITDDGVIVKPNSYFNQKFTFDTTNKTFTMSVLTADNILSAYTVKTGIDAFYYNGVVNGIRLELYSNPNGTSYFMAYPTESSKIFNAAKLELGSQQTLAHQDENGVWQLNEIPDYGEQLARCQRYQFSANPKRYGRPAIGVSTSQSGGAFVLNLPVTMRAIPTVTFRNLQVFYLGQNYNVTSINVSGMTDNAVLLDVTFDAAIPNGVALILVSNVDSELFLNANL